MSISMQGTGQWLFSVGHKIAESELHEPVSYTVVD